MTQIWGEMTGVSRKEPVLFEAFRTYHQNLMLPKVGTVLRSMNIPGVKAAEPAREPGEPGSKVMLLRLVPRCCVSCSW